MKSVRSLLVLAVVATTFAGFGFIVAQPMVTEDLTVWALGSFATAVTLSVRLWAVAVAR